MSLAALCETILTIRGWASENNLELTDNQIQELYDGLTVSREMERYTTGWTLGDRTQQREQEAKVEKLERTIAQLEGFIASKGYKITANENGIVTHDRMMLPGLAPPVTRNYAK